MALTIGSNSSSLKAQSALARTTEQQSTAFQRLSSGLRINKPSDDAAGSAVAASLDVASKVYKQGIRNLTDGSSTLALANAGLEELSSILTREQELAQQAANGTFSTSQRGALNTEANALVKEYNRVLHSAKFNGQGVIDGTYANGLRLQAGFGTA